MSDSPSWIDTWEKAQIAPPPIIADCTCVSPGPMHLSVTSVGEAVVGVAVCMGCGGILGTGIDAVGLGG